MKQDLLTFQFLAPTVAAGNMLGAVVNKLNSKPWMGREARTCRIVRINVTGQAGAMASGFIVVRHRPYGWKLRLVNQDENGRLLDDQSKPLPEGEEPVIREVDALEEVDFNRFDFGKLVERLRDAG